MIRAPRALCLLRHALHYRRAAFCEGLSAAGFEVVEAMNDPRPGDIVLTWNRYGVWHEEALRFERAGARALVVENGYLGKGWRDGEWFALAIGHHAGAGRWVDGGQQRWDELGVELAPWRRGGTETVILAQRGIGECSVRSPDGWAERVQHRIGGRVRPHPGKQDGLPPLEDDLRDAREVVTWHSAGALQALLLGIPVWHDFDRWIGAPAARPLGEHGGEPLRDDAARLAMFRRLAWAMWQLDEIRSGRPFQHVLA